MRASPIAVSLIICTRNRAQALEACLQSVGAAWRNKPALEMELIVVDNGSTDGTMDLVEAWIKQTPAIQARLVSESRPGLSAARNAGLRVARGDILAFTDDDCRLAPDYFLEVESTYAAHADGPTIIGGRILLGDPRDLLMSVIEDERPARLTADNVGGFIAGCNLTFNVEALQRIGAFDERLGAGSPIPAGEDTDFIFRGRRAGVVVLYRPEICVSHFHGRRTPEEAAALGRNYSIGAGALIAKHFGSPMTKYLWWGVRDAALEAVALKRNRRPYGLSFRSVLCAYIVGVTRWLKAGRLGRRP